jgi:hypothetical protein
VDHDATDGLRLIVESLDREMSRLLARPSADTTALLSSWAELIEFLALEPPPELPECPVCGSPRAARRAARCGTCGKEHTPSPLLASA